MSFQESCAITTNNETVTGNYCVNSEIDNSCSSEPIKILLFPPKNKQFRFDEQTKRIEIEPIESPNRDINNMTDEIAKTGLTPLVDQCRIYGENDSMIDITEELGGKTFKIKQILKIETVFDKSKIGKDCFLKGCKWSMDGLCLLSNSEDNVLRLFEISDYLVDNPKDDLQPVLKMKEGGTIYDFAWYPLMNSSNPISCVFASTSQDSPIHLWDAYTGQLRATYQPINQYDEVTCAYSIAFSPDGSKIYSGFKKCLRIFDIGQPGRISEQRNLKPKGDLVFQSNIISTISINPSISGLYALGSYDKSIGIYAEPGDLICILRGHSGGITQITFSSDGNYLFSGGRKDQEILCWDVRNPGKIVFSIERRVDTQQKMQFDLSPDQTYLITGTTDCNIKMFNIKTVVTDNILHPVESWKGHDDCINGVQFHPSLPLIASCSGQRHITPMLCDNDDQDEDNDIKADVRVIENSIKIWSIKDNS